MNCRAGAPPADLEIWQAMGLALCCDWSALRWNAISERVVKH
jgi:hypothetical protein